MKFLFFLKYMARPKKKRLGIGAKCTVLLSRLHPTMLLNEKYINQQVKQRISGLVIKERAERQVNRRKQICIVFAHDDFPEKELYCVERWVAVD